MKKLLKLTLVFLFISCKTNQKKSETIYRCGEISSWGVQYCKDLSKDDFYLIYHHGIKIGEGIPNEKTDFINGKVYYKNRLYTGFIFNSSGNFLDNISEYNQGELIIINLYKNRLVNDSSFRIHKRIILKDGEIGKIITYDESINNNLMIDHRKNLTEQYQYSYSKPRLQNEYEEKLQSVNKIKGGYIIDYFNGDKKLDSSEVFFLNGKKKDVYIY